MNHLTNLYKHKCEQLQEQINNLKKMLNEVSAPPDGGLQQPYTDTHFYQYGPRGTLGRAIPVGEPGSQQHGPPIPRPNGPPPQPLPDATQEQWFQWLDRMWQWYIKNYPYSTTNGNGDNIQQWWRIWHDIQEIHPGQGHGWEWEDQERRKGSPPSNRPLVPPDRTKPHFDPDGP